MESVVLSLGGSVLIPDQDDASYLTDLAKLIRQEGEEPQAGNCHWVVKGT